MTRIGYAVVIALMGVSLIALIVCSVRQRRPNAGGKDLSTRPAGSLKMTGERKLETVSGEPVVFRTAEMRFVTCKSSMQVGREQAEALGFDPRRETERAQARQYWEKELAYRLADLLLKQGGIRFQLEGNIYRAELKAVLPERSGT